MLRMRRAAGVGVRLKALATFAVRIIANNQIAGDEIHFFPIVVGERRSCVDARFKAKQPRPCAAVVCLIKRTGQNLLLDACRIACRGFPTALQVNRVEFVMLLVHWHCRSP